MYSELEEIRDEEQEAFDNMPGSLQYSERGEQTGQNADDLNSVVSDFESVIDALNDVINNN